MARPELLGHSFMSVNYAERYVLRNASGGQFLGVNDSDDSICSSDFLEQAWTFHTHEGAVHHALLIGEVRGETPDVVKISI